MVITTSSPCCANSISLSKSDRVWSSVAVISSFKHGLKRSQFHSSKKMMFRGFDIAVEQAVAVQFGETGAFSTLLN
jgi:hypothetical protein